MGFFFNFVFMNVILFDTNRDNYYPLSYTRPISYFRVGILTIKEKWETYFKSVSVKTENYLSIKFACKVEDDNLWVNSKIIPSKSLVTELKNLRIGEALKNKDLVIAFRNQKFDLKKLNIIETHVPFKSIENLCDIFTLNGNEINNDFQKICSLRDLKWQGNASNLNEIKKSNVQIGSYPIFVEKGAKLNHSILNTSDGPIYIGKDAEIMEGSIIRGPFAMLNNSVLKIGSKIYGASTIGPYCKVGGELNNSILFGYSSKAHDGFLGNSIIGEWCNLGAGTNNSNLKNNYADVKMWNYQTEGFKNTNLQFCGLIMGDHSKSGINTMFNTGTVVGVSANIFGSGFPRNFIPSFSWGGASGFSVYKLPRFFDVAKKVFLRRGISFDNIEEGILSHIYSITKKYRNEK